MCLSAFVVAPMTHLRYNHRSSGVPTVIRPKMYLSAGGTPKHPHQYRNFKKMAMFWGLTSAAGYYMACCNTDKLHMDEYLGSHKVKYNF